MKFFLSKYARCQNCFVTYGSEQSKVATFESNQDCNRSSMPRIGSRFADATPGLLVAVLSGVLSEHVNTRFTVSPDSTLNVILSIVGETTSMLGKLFINGS